MTYSKINALVFLLAGISLLLMAVPRFSVAINQIPVNNFFSSSKNDRFTPRIEKIQDYILLTKASIARHEAPEYWQDLAILSLHQVQIKGSIGEQSKALLSHAENAARQSLSLSPGNSFLSYQLAVISALEKKPASQVAKLLMMSIMSSPHEPGFMLHRLDFCLMYFTSLEHADYSYLADQILLVWAHWKNDFLALLKYRRDYFARVKILLQGKNDLILNEITMLSLNDV